MRHIARRKEQQIPDQHNHNTEVEEEHRYSNVGRLAQAHEGEEREEAQHA